MAFDLQTQLAKFLADLYAGALGVTLPITKILVGDGTNAAPSVALLSDSTTGLYGSAGAVRVSAGGVANALVVTNGAASVNGNFAPGSLSSGSTTFLTTTGVTGLSITNTGVVQRMITKVTLTSNHAAYQAAALTADVTLAVIPAKTRVMGLIFDTTIAWAGPAGTLAFTVGKTAGGNEYLVSHDVKSAAVTKGLADADFGTAMIRATAIQTGDLPSWTATTALQCRLTSGTGNLGTGAATNLTQGTTVCYVISEVYP